MAKMIYCPFYFRDNSEEIHCEGLMTEQQIIRFKDPEQKRAFIRSYCGNKRYWKACEYSKRGFERWHTTGGKYETL